LLSDATRLHNSRDLLERLQQLLDFLNLPGPVSKYLPPKDGLPLRYMGILDLHIEAAAQHAVDLMLSSSLSAGDASTLQAAFFCVQVPPEEDTNTHYKPVIYSLSGYYTPNILARWPKGSSAAFTAGDGVQAVQLPTGSGIGGITSSSNAGRIRAQDLIWSSAKYGQRVSKASHTMLFERISTVLSRELAQVPCNGRTGALQSCSFTAHFDQLHADCASSVWAIWW
jgi:hypothetical protein